MSGTASLMALDGRAEGRRRATNAPLSVGWDVAVFVVRSSPVDRHRRGVG